MSKARIGVVGTGRMGANMARRLKDQGYPVTAVYDAFPKLVARTTIPRTIARYFTIS